MIVGYLVLTAALGSALARRTKSAKQWAVAGGGMSVVMVAAGIAGTRIGGVGTYGVAGDVVTGGVWNMWYGVNTFLAMALVGVFYARFYRRLRLQTVGEIFERRFGSRRCTILTSLCVQTEYLIVNIIEPFVIGKILAGVTDIPFPAAVMIGGLVIITYTTLGGLWGSAVTNVVHCTVILFGLAAVGLLGLNHLGGWSGVVESANSALTAAGRDPDAWWSWTGPGPGALLGMTFSIVIHTPAASVYVNFASAAKSERAIVPAFLLGGVIAAAMPFLAGFIGIEALARYGADAQLSSYTSITRLATEINPWIGGIALASILAAVISSGGPILLSSATMFVQDWLPFARGYDEKRRLRAFRIATIVYGTVAASIAATASIGSILELLLLGFAMVCPPAIAVGYLIYWRRTSEAGAFWGMALGYGIGLIWFGLIKYAEHVEFAVTEGSSAAARLFHWLFVFHGEGIDPSYATTLIPLLAVPLISILGRRSTDGSTQDGAGFYRQLAAAKSPTDQS